MVAIVSGKGLGLTSTSLNRLGQQGALGQSAHGRNGEGVYVNATTGNLVVQRTDELLMGVGPDVNVLRTYNSQGQVDGDNNDNWRIGLYRQIKALMGTVNTAGSTVIRVEADGAERLYRYDIATARYLTQDGIGSTDTLIFNTTNSEWAWTDGNSRVTETYNWVAGQGKLLNTTDVDGNSVTYTYSGELLTKVTTANSTSTQLNTTELIYDTANGKTNNLLQIKTTAWNSTNNQIITRVRYTYDSSNRLSTVTVDLSPEDNNLAATGSGNINDGKIYVTTYTYADAISKRIAGITESNGASISFVYDSLGRVQEFTEGGNRTTKLTYSGVNGSVTTVLITDPLGNQTTVRMDAEGRLIELQGPAVSGVSQLVKNSYDNYGRVLSSTDARSLTTEYQYDTNGNQTLVRNAAGNTITRTYGSLNQLLSETRYTVADPDGAGALQPSGALTTRYVYNTRNKLRYVISAEGRVTQYLYGTSGNANGAQTSAIQYTANLYTTAGTPTEANLDAWVAAITDKSKATRVDTAYDFRGQVSSITRFDALTTAGVGVTGASSSRTDYIYDPAGNLLQTIEAKGVATTATTTDFITQYFYDGLSRVYRFINSLGVATVTQFDDAGNKTTTSLANGLATSHSYNKMGELIGRTEADGSTALGSTTYVYDKNGQLRQSQDPTGVKNYRLYDAAGRQVAHIEADGSLVESVYNANNQIVRTIRYATAVSSANLAALQNDINAGTNTITLDSLRPAASPSSDRSSWMLYDNANRLAKTIDELGFVTETRYDGAGRVVSSTRYNTALSSIQRAALSTTTPPDHVNATVASDAANDRSSRNFYSADGLLLGSLDGAGYLTENQYDAAGRLIHTIAYASSSPSTQWANGTLEQLRPTANNAQDIHNWVFYNSKNQVIAEVNGEGYLSEHLYDPNGNKTQTTRWANKALINPALINVNTLISALRPVANAGQDQINSWTFTDLNQIRTFADFQGTITQYSYNNVGQLIKTDKALGTTELRTLQIRYDKQGRATGELTAQGSAALAALGATPTTAQLNSVWSQYGLTHVYDEVGRRISTVDQNGNKTRFYYNTDGNLTHTINALGEVTETKYNALNQAISTIVYGTRLNPTTLATLNGGLVNSTLSTAVAAITKSALDSKTSATYTLRGQTASNTDELGNVNTKSYNAFGEILSTTQKIDALTSLITNYTHDQRGLLKKTEEDTAGISRITSVIYDAFGRIISTTDGTGKTRTNTYDRLGRVVQTKDPLNIIRSSTYNAFDRVLTQVDGLGNITTTAYDKNTRSVTITTPEGIQTVTTVNRHGETISLKDGNGRVTTYAYDLNGRLTSTSDALGNTTGSTYDNSGLKISTTDANGIKITYLYDAANRVLTKTHNPNDLNLITRYSYDAKGQSVSMTDPMGVVTTTKYDLKGQVTEVAVDPSGLNLRTQYSHNARGEKLTVIEGAGTTSAQTAQYVYDKLGRRIKEVREPATLGLTTQYSYDKNNNLITKTDANGNVTRYIYDDNNRLVYVVDSLGGVIKNTFDNEGRVTKTQNYATPISLTSPTALPLAPTLTDINNRITANAGDQITQTVYDKDGRKIRIIVDPVGLNLKTEYRYDKAGNIAYQTDVNGNKSHYVYDSNGSLIYAINNLGQVTQKQYDALGQVIQTRAYRTTINIATLPALDASTGGYNLQTITNLVSSIASSGDLITQYTYDAKGRKLSEAQDPAGLNLVSRFSYDATNHLVKQTNPNGESTYYINDAVGRLIYEIKANGEVSQHSYDANGHHIQARKASIIFNIANLPAPDAQSGAYDLSNVATILAPLFTSNDQIVRNIYNGAGRLVYSIDALGYVTLHRYDGAGHEVRQIKFATPVNLNGAPTVDQVDAALQYSAQDQTTWTLYDAAGRAAYTVDALGYVSGLLYDGLGQVIQTIRYATPVNLTREITLAEFRSLLKTSSSDVTQRTVYNAAGRPVYSIDALGYVTENQYDAFGQVTRTVQHGVQTNFTTPPTLAQVKAALASGWSQDFTVNTAGLSIADTTNVQRVNGALKFNSGNSTTSKFPSITATQFHPVGSTFRGEITTDANIEARTILFSVNDSDGNTPVHAHSIKLYKNQVYAAFLDAQGASQLVLLGTIKNNTTYVAEIETDAQGSTAYLYEKGSTRAQGYCHRRDQTGWRAARMAMWSEMWTGLTGTGSTTVDNLSVSVPSAITNSIVYDAAGRPVYSIDALGYVSEKQYDAFGQVTRTIQHGVQTNFTTPPTLAQVKAALASSWTQDFTVDTAGLSIQDAFNIQRLNGALKFNSGNSSITNLPVAYGVQYHPMGSTYRGEITTDNRVDARALVFSIADTAGHSHAITINKGFVFTGYLNAQGAWEGQTLGAIKDNTTYVAEIETDAQGSTVYLYEKGSSRATGVSYRRNQAGWVAARLVVHSTFDSSLADTGSTTVDNLSVSVPSAITNSIVYDAAGRPVFSIDALGYVSEKQYDAFGQVIQVTRYAISLDASGTSRNSSFTQLKAWVNSVGSTTSNISARTLYDNNGRPVYTIDGAGYVTKTDFNAFGQVISSTRYATSLTATGTARTLDKVALDNWVSAWSSPNKDIQTRHVFDLKGQELYSLDPSGYVTAYEYNAVGQRTAITRHANPISTGSAPTLSDVLAALASKADASKDQRIVQQYTLRGELASRTDALGYTERYQYDAFGGKIAFTNAKGSVWRYEYDALGRQTREITPQVSVYTLDKNSTVEKTENVNLITQLQYDAFGRLLSRTEVAGRPEARTTVYQYDVLGHQTSVIYPELNGQNPRSDTVYDAYGRAIVNQDVGGVITYKAYDSLGRVRFEVDGEHYLTEYKYDGNNETQLIRYANKLNIDFSSWQTLSETDVQALIIPNAADRVLNKAYDQNGLLIETREAAVLQFDSRTGQTFSFGKITRNTYNSLGKLILQSEQLDPSGTRLANTYFYYNTRGEKIAQVDAEGYLTTWEYDETGDATKQTEYAKALVANTWNLNGYGTPTSTTPQTAPNSPLGYDRVTVWTYDRNNRKATETRLGVEVSERTADNQISQVVRNITTTYGYDAVGQQIQTTDAQGNTQFTYYDALGRTIAASGITRQVSTTTGGVLPSPTVAAIRMGFNGNRFYWSDLSALGSGDIRLTAIGNLFGSSANLSSMQANTGIYFSDFKSLIYGNFTGLKLSKYVNGQWLTLGELPATAGAQSNKTLVVWPKNNAADRVILKTRPQGGAAAWQDVSAQVQLKDDFWQWDTSAYGSGQYDYELSFYAGSTLLSKGSGALSLIQGSDSGSITPVAWVDERLLDVQSIEYAHRDSVKTGGGADESGVYQEIYQNTDYPSRIQLRWNSLQNWGDGDVIVEINYLDRSNRAGSYTQTISSTQSLQGVALEWPYNADRPELNMMSLQGMRVYKMVNGSKVLFQQTNGIDQIAPKRLLLRGNTSGLTAITIAGVGTRAVSSLGGGLFAVEIGDLPRGNYSYTTVGGAQVGGQFQLLSGNGSQPTKPMVQTLSLSLAVNSGLGGFPLNLSWSGLMGLGAGNVRVAVETDRALYQSTYSAADGISGVSFSPQATTYLNASVGDFTMGWGGKIRVRLYKVIDGQEFELAAVDGVANTFAQTARQGLFITGLPDASYYALAYRPKGSSTQYLNQLVTKSGTGGLIADTTTWPTGEYEILLYANGLPVNTSPMLASVLNGAQSLSTAQITTNTQTLTALTEFKLDVYGKVVHQIGYANGAAAATASGYSLAGLSGQDQHTYSRYDQFGNKVQTIGAEGETMSSQYDAYGHITQVNQLLNNTDGKPVWRIQNYRYDRTGRQVLATNKMRQETDETSYTHTRYNAFGEVNQQGMTYTTGPAGNLPTWYNYSGPLSTWFNYDNAGRLIKTNKDGVVKTYLYDAQGNKTAEIQNSGLGQNADLLTARNLINYSYADIATMSGTDIRRTQTEYDRLGRIQRESSMQFTQTTAALSTYGTPVIASMTSLGGVISSAFIGGTDENGNALWAGYNEIQAPAGDLVSQLGALYGLNRIRINITYTTLPVLSGHTESSPIYSPGVERNISFLATQSALRWQDSGGNYGGIASIKNVSIDLLDDPVNGGGLQNLLKAPGILLANAVNSRVLVVKAPFAPGVSGIQQLISYRQIGAATWTTPANTVNGDTMIVRLGQLPAGNYEYQIAGNKLIDGLRAASGQGIFIIGSNGSVSVVNNTANSHASFTTQTTREQSLDRWGNVISTGDARNSSWITNYRYNYANQVVEKALPTVANQLTTGAYINQRPISYNYFDVLGRAIASKDANGNLNHIFYDAAGMPIRELKADGSSVEHVFDIFGRKIKDRKQDVNQTIETQFSYNRSNQLIAEKDALGYTKTYGYDAAGNRTWEISPLGYATAAYFYDNDGRVVTTRIPVGATTEIRYDVHGNKVYEKDGAGGVMTWTYDEFGRLQNHKDLGGVTTYYEYDLAGQLIRQSNGRGQDIRYSYYQNGLQSGVNDVGVNSQTNYTYDQMGNRTGERFTQNGKLYKDAKQAFDQLGRLTEVSDVNTHLIYGYDLNGNRRSVTGNYTDSGNIKQNISDWYRYDSLNRIIISSGINDNGWIRADAAHGIELAYDGLGRRKSAMRFVNGTGWQKETYVYDLKDQLTSINTQIDSGADLITSKRTYDAHGRVIKQETFNNSGKITETRTTTYDYNGWMSGQTIESYPGNGLSNVTRVNPLAYDGVGNMFRYEVVSADGSKQIFSVGYGLYDNYKETSQTVDWYAADGRVISTGRTASYHDVNGNQISFFDASNTQNNRSFVVNSMGQILLKTQGNKYQQSYFANDRAIGSADSLGNADFDHNYTPVTPNSLGTPGSYVVNTGDTLRSIAQAVFGDAQLWYLIADANGLGADAGLTPGKTLIIPNKVSNFRNANDTFKPYKAGEVIGDTTPTANLPAPPMGADKGCGVVGVVIVAIVAIVVTVITAGAGAIGFGAVGTATTATGTTVVAAGAGATSLTLGTATLGQVFAAGSMALGGSLGATGIAAAAVGAAAGSLVSQGVGVAMGIQDNISWKQVGISALGAGLTAGIGSLASGVNLAQPFTQYGAAAIKSAAASIASQGLNIITGQQHNFSWKQVAIAAIGGMVGQGLDDLGLSENKLQLSWKDAGDFGRVAAGVTAGALQSIGTQGLSIALGLQDKFSGRQVGDASIDAFARVGANIIGDRFSYENQEARDNQINELNKEFINTLNDLPENGIPNKKSISQLEAIVDAKDYINGQWGDKGGMGHILAHGMFGGAVAALRGKDILAGALGGLTEGLFAPYIPDIRTSPQTSSQYGLGLTPLDHTLQNKLIGLPAAAIAQALDRDASVAQVAAENAYTNNFLGRKDRARLDQLMKINDEERKKYSAEIVMLATQDQLSDRLLEKYQKNIPLIKDELENLEIYIANYAIQEGESRARALLNGELTQIKDYIYPYAGSSAQKRDADAKLGLSWYQRRTRSENEYIFNEAVNNSYGDFYRDDPLRFLPTRFDEAIKRERTQKILKAVAQAPITYSLTEWLAKQNDMDPEKAENLAMDVSDLVAGLSTALRPRLTSRNTSRLSITNLQMMGRTILRGTNLAGSVSTPIKITSPNPGANTGSIRSEGLASFASKDLLVGHFNKHGKEFRANNPQEYLEIGQDIMKNGVKISYFYKHTNEIRTGYVASMRNAQKTGETLFGFVGTNKDGAITTIHVKPRSELFGLLGDEGQSQIKAFRNNTVGPDPQIGWKYPYFRPNGVGPLEWKYPYNKP